MIGNRAEDGGKDVRNEKKPCEEDYFSKGDGHRSMSLFRSRGCMWWRVESGVVVQRSWLESCVSVVEMRSRE